MKTIILDTNILMAIAQFNVDIFSEIERICDFAHEICILQGTLNELEKIKAEQTGKHRTAAKLALDMVKKKKVKVIEHPSLPVDDILTEKSQVGAIVVTQDSALKKRLKKPYITLRKKKYLILI